MIKRFDLFPKKITIWKRSSLWFKSLVLYLFLSVLPWEGISKVRYSKDKKWFYPINQSVN